MSWRDTTLEEVALSIRNGLFAKRPSGSPPGTPILRISAVRGGVVGFDDLRYVAGIDESQKHRFSVEAGDLLMTRYNGSRDLVGSVGLVPPHDGPVIHPDKLIRIALDRELVEPRFVNLQLQTPRVRQFLEPRIRTTAGQSGIAGGDVRAIPLSLPSLDEQRRIVAILEDHLSRLEAAESAMRLTERRLKALVKSVLTRLIPDVAHYPTSWERSTVAEAGAVELGRQRHPDWHTGPNMKPYLRVANVFEDRIDVRDVKEMHWPDATFERFKLHPGDVLLNEGQTPELLGRPALYRGEPADVGFTNSLLRFKASDRVLPDFALLVFRRHMHAGRFTRESRITTNIAHLSASRLKPIEFPIPSRDDQQRIVDAAREQLDNVRLLEAAVNAARVRSAGLRRSLLDAAFAGQLTGSATELSDVGEMIGA